MGDTAAENFADGLDKLRDHALAAVEHLKEYQASEVRLSKLFEKLRAQADARAETGRTGETPLTEFWLEIFNAFDNHSSIVEGATVDEFKRFAKEVQGLQRTFLKDHSKAVAALEEQKAEEKAEKAREREEAKKRKAEEREQAKREEKARKEANKKTEEALTPEPSTDSE